MGDLRVSRGGGSGRGPARGGGPQWPAPAPRSAPHPPTPGRGPSDPQASSRSRRGVVRRLVGPRRADPPPARERDGESGLAARGIAGNLVVTRDRVVAWYRVPPQSWSFSTAGRADRMITDLATRIAELGTRRVFLRVTSRPFPARRWAEALDAASPNPLPSPCPHHRLRSEPGCGSCVEGAAWYDHLAAEQMHLDDHELDDKEVYLGVEVAARSLAGRAAELAWRQAPVAEAGDLAGRLDELDQTAAGRGLEAAPATPEQMGWLLHRSVGLGMPPPQTVGEHPAPQAPSPVDPEVVETTDLGEFTDGVRWAAEPYAPTVTVTGHDEAGAEVTRHVAVLTLGRMADQHVPEGGDDPWIQRTDRLPFPVEWSATFDVRSASAVATEMRNLMARVRSQRKHYVEEHGQDEPADLERQGARAREIEDEQRHGFGGTRTRVSGWFRLAVSGPTRAEALRRAGEVTRLYTPGATVVRPADQYRLAREFIPGEPVANVAYRQRMPVTTLAGGMPAATATVGDRQGVLLGQTCGTSARAAIWDPWLAHEHTNTSGVTTVTGTQGAGKTSLAGLVVYKSVRRGAAGAVLDPVGRLQRLCELPELAPHARAVNLLNAEPGTLCPYRVVAEPRREDFQVDEHGRARTKAQIDRAWGRAREAAREQRRGLTYDILTMLLPRQVTDGASADATVFALEKAIGATDASPRSSPEQVLEALRNLDDEGLADHGRRVADSLARVAAMPQARLFFPVGPPPEADHADPAATPLTVLTLQGLTLPHQGEGGGGPESMEARLSVPLLHLAAWLTSRFIYDRPTGQRKLLVVDETHALVRSGTGQSLLNDLSRNSRKQNTRVLLLSQNAGDVLTAGVGNLTGAVLAGRAVDPGEQRQALELLGLQTGVGYEQVLESLPPGEGEFIFADGTGGMERIAVDLDFDPRVAAALNTTPDPAAAAGADRAPLREGGNGQPPARSAARAGRRRPRDPAWPGANPHVAAGRPEPAEDLAGSGRAPEAADSPEPQGAGR